MGAAAQVAQSMRGLAGRPHLHARPVPSETQARLGPGVARLQGLKIVEGLGSAQLGTVAFRLEIRLFLVEEQLHDQAASAVLVNIPLHVGRHGAHHFSAPGITGIAVERRERLLIGHAFQLQQ
ncbi:hypothetical protein D3C79_922660 [compost metagenome]